MQMTSIMAQAWIEFLQRRLQAAASLEELEACDQHNQHEIDSLWNYGLVDADEYNRAHADRVTDYTERRRHLIYLLQCENNPLLEAPWANHVREFSGEAAPRACNCKHKRTGTGAFFQSIGVLQCNTCRNWQVIRKPIK